MILDGYWKRELAHNKRSLKFWLKVGSVFDKYAEHQVNKAILYSAVIIRKMFEDEKGAETVLKNGNLPMPPLQLLKYKVKITAYPFSGDKDLIIERVIPDNYDYSKVYSEEVELNKVCNQIIHSFVWSIAYKQDAKKIHGVLFASDKSKTEVMYLLMPEDFIKAIDFCIEYGNI